MEERIIFGGMGGCVGYFIATMMKMTTEMTIVLCIIGLIAGALFGWWMES